MAQSAAIQDASYTRYLCRYSGLFNNLLELLLETVSGVSERAGKRMSDNGPYPGDSLLRLQRVETNILKAVDAVCRENGLVYFLDSGTCLGAVRHGGFIPWDDDADIGMPYDDYQKFLEIAPAALPEGYSLHTCMNSEGFSALWSKVYKDGTRFIDANSKEASSNQGIFVDIFPFFPMESDARARSKQVRSCANWQYMSYLHAFSNPKIPTGTPLKTLVVLGCRIMHYTVARAFAPAKCQRRLFQKARAEKPGTLWFDPCYATGGPFEKDWIFPTQTIDFDGVALQAPRDTDRFLTALYGSYMELPPESERYTHLPEVLDFGDGVNVMA
jgi:lipopolysaccharide cholinephosphotransferase